MLFSMWSLVGLVAFGLIVAVTRNRGNWPAGPYGVPLLGVLPDKRCHLHQQLKSLAAQYGDFFSFNMGRDKVIVLTSPTTVNDLIVKRGGKYSSRPSSSPTARIVAQSRLGQMEYGDQFRVSSYTSHGC